MKEVTIKPLHNWQQVKLGDVCDIFNGSTPSTKNNIFWNGNIDWYTPNDLSRREKYLFGSERKISDRGWKSIRSISIPHNSIILSSRAPIGYLGITTTNSSFNQGCKGMVPKKDISVFFLFYRITKSIEELKKLGSGSTFMEIGKKDIEKFPVLLPPLPEQHRIVAVLETWDKAIDLLKKKIVFKKQVKKGLMQKLLSGDMRLSGFSGEWKVVKLGDVATIIMGQSPSSSNYNENGEGIPLIQGNNDIKKRNTIERIWTTEITKKAEYGDIILTVRAPVGTVGIAHAEICLGRGVCAIRASKIDHEFLYKLLEFYELRWENLAQGSTFSSINSTDIKKFSFKVGVLKEQQAIASILTTADNEITLLEQKLHALEQQKKFLLNNLVTGEIRTPEDLLQEN